jgi:tetratricopeptide (TPR) repeat protein
MAAGGPDDTVSVDLKATARALLDARQCGDAVAAYAMAIQARPDDYELYNDSAFCLYDLGRVGEAVMRWDEALLRNPSSADARAGLGMALFTQGLTEAALESYAQALAIEPRYADPAFLRDQRSWSDTALTASQPLRDALGAP